MFSFGYGGAHRFEDGMEKRREGPGGAWNPQRPELSKEHMHWLRARHMEQAHVSALASEHRHLRSDYDTYKRRADNAMRHSHRYIAALEREVSNLRSKHDGEQAIASVAAREVVSVEPPPPAARAVDEGDGPAEEPRGADESAVAPNDDTA